MSPNSPRIVLIDLLRGAPADSDASPARVPCLISSEELAHLCSFVAGNQPTCSVVLAFRDRDLDDLGVAAIACQDFLVGLFDTSGGPLAEVSEAKRLTVVDTVQLARPGRHLLCAHFRSSEWTPQDTIVSQVQPTALGA